jgi:hypothetical protein
VGFFEIVGERFNRGPVGGFDPESRELPDPPSPYAFAWLFIALLAIALWTLMLWSVSEEWTGFLIGMALSAAYLLVASRVRPRPDYSNVGLVRGLIDHPLRISDDLNRLLAFLLLFLLPGRLIGVAFRHGISAYRAR